MMTVSDLAALTGLGWDTIKNIIKAKLERDFGRPGSRICNTCPLMRFTWAGKSGFTPW